MTLRRQFDLLPEDRKFLDEYGPAVGNDRRRLPVGADPRVSDARRLHPPDRHRRDTDRDRLPNAELDMVYFFPALARKDGRPIGATKAMQALDGKQFQRWSRHRTRQNPWKTGRDNLGTHIILIEDWLAREFEK